MLPCSSGQPLWCGVCAAQVHCPAPHVLVWLLFQLIVVLAADTEVPLNLTPMPASDAILGTPCRTPSLPTGTDLVLQEVIRHTILEASLAPTSVQGYHPALHVCICASRLSSQIWQCKAPHLRRNRATLSAASAAALLNRPAPSAATGTALDANQAGPREAVSRALPTYVFNLDRK